MTKQQGFTILYVAIALIFLVIFFGAIYAGKNLFEENNVKSLAAQIAKYDSAISLFTQKYHALPGDVQGTAELGITQDNSDGDGNNVVADKSGKIISADGEITNFWMHLSKSEILDEKYDGAEGPSAVVGKTFPQSKVGEKIGIVAFTADGKTFYQIGFDHADSKKIFMTNRALKTDEAFLLDKKIDDGNPQKGRILATGGEKLNELQNQECVRLNDYDKNNSSPVCQLRIEVR